MGFARSFRRQMKRKEVAAKKKRRKVLFEPLEPRILLSADLSYTMSGGANDLTLKLQNIVDTDTLQLINNEDPNPDTQVVVSQALADTMGVVITGSELADIFTIDFSRPFFAPNGILFSDAFAGDSDMLRVVGKANVWNIAGGNGGDVDGAGVVDFQGVENLTGGVDADTFALEAGGSLDGGLGISTF